MMRAQIAAGLRVVECGRLCVDPATSAAGPGIVRFLAECTLAAEFFGRRVDVIYGFSTVPHFRYYRRLGFVRAAQVPQVEVLSTRVRGILSSLARENVDRRMAERLSAWAEQLQSHGRIAGPFGPIPREGHA
jgi:hypothetical protein